MIFRAWNYGQRIFSVPTLTLLRDKSTHTWKDSNSISLFLKTNEFLNIFLTEKGEELSDAYTHDSSIIGMPNTLLGNLPAASANTDALHSHRHMGSPR